MILGALIDAGVPLGAVRAALGSLAISSDTVWTERVTRAGVSATKFQVRGEAPLDHAHDHEGHDHHHEHPRKEAHTHAHEERHHAVHRTLADISTLIDGSALSASGKERAKDLFQVLGAAEAAIHGTSMDQVHLHEVGALDSIIDIVGTVFAIESLEVDRIVSSPLNVGSGTVSSAHGLYPVPAPATMRLLAGAPIYSGPQKAEMVTPTGALLIQRYADAFGTIPAMRVGAIGYGAGSRDVAGTPNVLRVLLGEGDSTAAAHSVVIVEAEIDDMN